MPDRRLVRIIDANSNRTREALRVVEDVLRFWHERGDLARRVKRERHYVARSCDHLLGQGSSRLGARDTATDPGRRSMPCTEATSRNIGEVLLSNFRRAEESLRVLEEAAKLVDRDSCRRFKRSRFRVYDLEKACRPLLEK